jgi:hypothetical protein
MTDPALEAAWNELHAVNDSLRWFVGRPTQHDERCSDGRWMMYAFDPFERLPRGVGTAPPVDSSGDERGGGGPAHGVLPARDQRGTGAAVTPTGFRRE